ncbi:hypothetical protein [Mariniphaga sediminis]|uniref:hypothetical protein n=1 Tax=Mariniphaga sediminis TaxID=1628158 RepID=UPI003569F259
MTKDEMLDLIVSWENLKLLIREAENHPDQLSVLMDIALYSKHPKSWRAAWIADKIHEKKPEHIAPFLTKIIRQLKKETDKGKKRHWLKLISQNEINEKHYSFLMNYCLDTFMLGEEPVAVRVHAMQILFNISEKETAFKRELASIIEHEIELHPTAGIQSRGRKLIQKLKKQINSGSHVL